MQSFVWYSMCVLLVVAVACDIASRRIPNILVVPFLVAGIGYSFVTGHLAGFYASLGGIGVSLLIIGFLCFLRGMGLGDLKLCMAVGAWIGPSQMTVAIVATFIFGGVMAVLWSLATGTLSKSMSNTGRLLVALGKRGPRPIEEFSLSNQTAQKMPYAPAIALGTLFSFFTGAS